jgi:uncharacterized protein (DUF2252 family)
MSLLTAIRNRKMASSAHAYVRGSTARFYEWLEASDRPDLPEGPAVWICGDCHVGNLGPVASTQGKLAIQVRDLDQTVIGNPAHDLIRLALSLAMAARGSDLPGVTTARMLERMMDGYEAAFLPAAQGETTDASDDMPGVVRAAMRQAARRSWKHLADERIEGVEPIIPIGKRFWRLTRAERAAVEKLFAKEPVRRLATSLRSRRDGAPVRVLDAAYWRKGCSSLGRLRMAVLVAIDKGKAERHCLMDVKEAIAPAAPRARAARMPRDNAQRVVTGADQLSPFLGGRMLAVRLLKKSVFVRELLPQDLKLEIERLDRDEAMEVAEFLARIVGRGHSRQMDMGERERWLAELRRSRSKSLDAPSWLWNWWIWSPRMRPPICSTVGDTPYPTHKGGTPPSPAFTFGFPKAPGLWWGPGAKPLALLLRVQIPLLPTHRRRGASDERADQHRQSSKDRQLRSCLASIIGGLPRFRFGRVLLGDHLVDPLRRIVRRQTRARRDQLRKIGLVGRGKTATAHAVDEDPRALRLCVPVRGNRTRLTATEQAVDEIARRIGGCRNLGRPLGGARCDPRRQRRRAAHRGGKEHGTDHRSSGPHQKELGQGDTDARPKPDPSASRISDSAAAANAPPMIAGQATAEVAASFGRRVCA